MKKIFFTIIAASIAVPALAWEGFDADTTNIVEVSPERLPDRGDEITLLDYETDSSRVCRVESVRRNKRTIELLVQCPENKTHTLVMDGL